MLGNENDEYPAGDNVQTVERWYPPETWGGVSAAQLNTALSDIAAGLPNGQRYSGASAAKGDRAAWRDEQFAVCQAAGARRLIAAQTIFNALAAAVPAMSEYAIQTNEMVTALPTGTNVGILSMGNNGWAGSWIGNLANLISAEAYRLAIPDKTGRGARLPFAKAPDVRSDDPAAIEPAMDILRAAQAKAISEIQAQMEKLNRELLAVVEKAA